MTESLKQLEEFLLEDEFEKDVTTQAVLAALGKDPLYEFSLIPRWDGVFSGKRWLELFSKKFPRQFHWKSMPAEGDLLEKGKIFAVASAPVSMILSLERTLLNGLQYFCGIATESHRYHQEVLRIAKEKNVEAPLLLHTRKMLPGLRPFILEALSAGGVAKHRETLSDRFLLKDNHRELLKTAGMSLTDFLVKLPPSVLKEGLFEADSESETLNFVVAGVKNILLDNFTPERLIAFLPSLPKDICIEVSGGIRFDTLTDFIMPGVHRLSVGALTHSTRALDISLDLSFESEA